ncbi:MAG: c-type cytochrome [Burkholderiales bacterium]
MKKLILMAVCLAWAGGAWAAGHPKEGKEKAKACAACHGEDGASPTADFPKLAGQHRDYLVKALTDYKSGARKNPVMNPMAANLSKQDIADLAVYFSSLPPAVVTRR